MTAATWATLGRSPIVVRDGVPTAEDIVAALTGWRGDVGTPVALICTVCGGYEGDPPPTVVVWPRYWGRGMIRRARKPCRCVRRVSVAFNAPRSDFHDF